MCKSASPGGKARLGALALEEGVVGNCECLQGLWYLMKTFGSRRQQSRGFGKEGSVVYVHSADDDERRYSMVGQNGGIYREGSNFLGTLLNI